MHGAIAHAIDIPDKGIDEIVNRRTTVLIEGISVLEMVTKVFHFLIGL